MVAFAALKAGDILYSVTTERAGNTTMSRSVARPVKVIEIDAERQKALVSGNGNPASWWSARKLSSLRRSPPKAKPNAFNRASSASTPSPAVSAEDGEGR